MSEPSRRDFIYIAAGAAAAAGGALTLWPFIDQMNPAADTLALASTEVDLSQVAEGQQITVMWRGKPVFVRHRTPAEIEEARSVDVSGLRDPATDQERLVPLSGGEYQPQFLIMVGICTHLGCVPLGNRSGDYDGWFCPCHGSHYDTAGRIRKGPAPKNLEVPGYEYLSDTVVKIG
ncbi:MAG: ubiquinol-cytochrome c reductase iron-sulfur subunit [Euryhalocaulis sp.]|uniref:ubiquinol-cytochrome c reductase iron-sulfur subunit n=1 Tax=Euryhalocaulis sp. TaxID=2744307 RepID=UPI001809532D|nr:ubiquinol-cytochrome c reductase iron-sulfur subunit [Euryhalocaulis sp.]MBA4802549.1 ubiquinol-cytochrome c reductase iron-sulfur subunit [Euryhalocaulis sp.]